MVWNLLIIREIFKGDHNAAVAEVAAARKLRRKQISALSGTLNYFWVICELFVMNTTWVIRVPINQTILNNLWIICDEHYMSALCSHKSECRSLNFCHFCQKLQNSKWLPFLERGKFFLELSRVLSRDTLWVKNFVKTVENLVRFRRY